MKMSDCLEARPVNFSELFQPHVNFPNENFTDAKPEPKRVSDTSVNIGELFPQAIYIKQIFIEITCKKSSLMFT